MFGNLVRLLLGQTAAAVHEAEAEAKREAPSWWWLTRGLVAVVLVGGWLFILSQNKFHIDAPVVVIMLAYFAVVMTVANLWRLGASAARPDDPIDDSWGRPLGARADLEREKKSLLKAIKEAEFDHAMGKLSKRDADDLIGMYRARAIDVLKELERLDAGAAQTPRQQIERELAVRLHLDERSKQTDKKATKAKAKAGKNKPARPAANVTDAPAVDAVLATEVTDEPAMASVLASAEGVIAADRDNARDDDGGANTSKTATEEAS